jgi:glutamate transport system permease protein
VVTCELSVLAFALALVVGTVIATFRVSPVGPLRFVGTAYVELFRNVPLTVHFVLFFFGLTKVGIKFDPFPTAVIVMTLYSGAFVAETVRSGINSVAGGQSEAARSLGLGFFQTFANVVLPQAFRTVTAPLGSLFIAHHKNTSIALVIAVAEIMYVSDRIKTDTAQPVAVFTGAAIAYLIITFPAGIGVGMLERRVAIKR